MALSNVLVVAANRGLGAALTTHLHEAKVAQVATTHRPQTACPPRQQAESTTVHMLDALDRAATHDLLQTVRPKTLISCVGGDLADSHDLPDLLASKSLVDAAVAAGVKRFVLLSALGAGNSEEAVPFQVMMTLRPFMLDKTDSEAYLRAHAGAMEWSIVRPAPLIDEGSGPAVVTEDVQCYGTITREHLASAVARIADSKAAAFRTLHVVDRTRVLVTSPYVRPLEFWEPFPFDEYEL